MKVTDKARLLARTIALRETRKFVQHCRDQWIEGEAWFTFDTFDLNRNVIYADKLLHQIDKALEGDDEA